MRILLSAILLSIAAAAPAIAAPGTHQATGQATKMHVSKDPNCGCCTDWIAIMERAGFDVTVTDMPNSQLSRMKAAHGITPALASCHTATIDGYVIEGHVPPDDVKRLLSERPQAIGLSVPGMPYGSPGMGPESERDAYDVLLIKQGQQPERFNQYEAGTRAGRH